MKFALLDENTIKALSWALIHSFWQGFIAAILVGIIITLTKKSLPAIRYNLLLAVLVTIFFSVIITFYVLLNAPVSSSPGTLNAKSSYSATEIQSFHAGTDYSGSFVDRFNYTCNNSAPVIVLGWIILMLIQFTRLSLGINHLRNLQYRNTKKTGQTLIIKMEELARRLGIKQTIKLIESELVTIPLTTGIIRPVILIPAGLLSNLPLNLVETILLHELAHIRRRDYLVNLLQSVVEIFLFFNPAVLWISSLIREEREKCADQVVVNNLKDKKPYLQALLYFEENTNAVPTLALTMTKPGAGLLGRIKHMVTLNNSQLSGIEKFLLLIAFIIVTTFCFVGSSQKPYQVALFEGFKISKLGKNIIEKEIGIQKNTFWEKPVAVRKSAVTEVSLSVTDSIPTAVTKEKEDDLLTFKRITIKEVDGEERHLLIEALDNNGKEYKVDKYKHDILSLQINGKPIALDKFQDYDELISFIEYAYTIYQRDMPEKFKYDFLRLGKSAVHFSHLRRQIILETKDSALLATKMDAIRKEEKAKMQEFVH